MRTRPALIVALMLLTVTPSRALTTEPPANDAFSAATLVTAIPFSATQDLTAATFEAGEKLCTAAVHTSWYSFTPGSDTDLTLSAPQTTASSGLVSIFEGTSLDALTPITTCRASGLVTLKAGKSYAIQLAAVAFETEPVSFSLIRQSGIAGTVTDNHGNPLADICVNAYVPYVPGVPSSFVDILEVTGADGTYQMRGVPPGTYVVAFYPCGDVYYLEEYHENRSTAQDADDVVVVAQQVTIVDAELEIAAQIWGTLTLSGGQPASGVCIHAYYASNQTYAGYGYTGANGVYAVGVPGGTFKIQFGCPGGSYKSTWYGGTDFASATPVTVEAEGLVEGIDGVVGPRTAPANDAFADAQPLTLGVSPFTDTVDLYHATVQAGEPAPCGATQSRTAWYALTANRDGLVAVTASSDLTYAGATLGVFTGESLETLEKAACNHKNTLGTNQIGFLAREGITYFVQVGSSSRSTMRVGIDWTFGGETLDLEAGTPCALLCPYWGDETRSAEQKHEDTCADEPSSPAGSWSERRIEVPASVTVSGEQRVPTHLVFVVGPEMDHDSWICRDDPEEGQSRFVATGANTPTETCADGPISCEEQVTIPVRPGETFILRIYNWADASSKPLALYGYKVAR